LTICYDLEVEGREAKEEGRGGREEEVIDTETRQDKMRQRAKQGRVGK
jgi:hypothetical protein